jgi:hypothetical protein
VIRRDVMARIAVVLAVLGVGLLANAGATTYLVRPDGTGDFTTIGAAVAAAAQGDTVLVAPGTYVGSGNKNITISGKNIVLQSEAGPDATIIALQGTPDSPARAFYFTGGITPAAVVDGFTIRGGYSTEPAGGGGAILLGGHASPTIRNCAFLDNTAVWVGGAVFGTSHGSLLVQGCIFEGNSADNGGALHTYLRDVQIDDCVFRENHSNGGGAISFGGVHGWVRHCLFEQNTTPDNAGGAAAGIAPDDQDVDVESCVFARNVGGSTFFSSSNLTGTLYLRNCTFSQNDSRLLGATAYFAGVGAGSAAIESSILAFDTAGQAVACEWGSPAVSCSDIYGNVGGDWVDGVATQYGMNRNFSLDPCFCDPENDDFTLWNYSPCAQVTCGTIGAWPVACWDPQGIADSEASDATQQRMLDVSASPNPFSGTTRISFASSKSGDVRVGIFDVAGREVRDFLADVMNRGPQSLMWDGRDHSGNALPSGIYLIRLTTPSGVTLGRVAMTK